MTKQRDISKLKTREEFHREWGGYITQDDFNTSYPSRGRIDRLKSAESFNRVLKAGKVLQLKSAPLWCKGNILYDWRKIKNV